MPAYEMDENSVNDSISKLSAKDSDGNTIIVTIPEKNKRPILQELLKVGIHHGSVYPDVGNQTKYLQDFQMQ